MLASIYGAKFVDRFSAGEDSLFTIQRLFLRNGKPMAALRAVKVAYPSATSM